MSKARFENKGILLRRVLSDDRLIFGLAPLSFSQVANRLPKLEVRGSTILEQGRVHSKSQPAIDCPKCGQRLEPGETQIRFEHAPPETMVQVASGWVCACGQSYVPGKVAKKAHRRAFQLGDKPNGKGRKKRRKEKITGETVDTVSIFALVQAKKFVDLLGGPNQARAALDALARLQ